MEDFYDKILAECRARHGRVVAIVTLPDGTQERNRYGISTHGTLMRFSGRSRRRGFDATFIGVKEARILPRPQEDTRTPAERYADRVRKWARYVLKHLHPNLWPELRKNAESVTQEKLARFCADAGISDGHTARRKAKEYGLPQIEDHKTLTLTGAKCPIPTDRVKAYLDAKKDFREDWQDGYDYSLAARLCPDGAYRAWLSQEFRGRGNGHYWTLISEDRAVFCEDD